MILFVRKDEEEPPKPSYPKKIPLKERIYTVAILLVTAGSFGTFVVATINYP